MKRKFDRSYWIILILLFIILIASVFLYRNMNSGASGNDNVVIGTLTFKNRYVERKYDSDVIWEKAESGIEIRNRDTIRSEDFSDAILTLIDNTKININENSMIYLDMNEGDFNLNFAYGSMSLVKKNTGGDNNTTIKIKSGGNTVEIQNSELTLEKKGKEELSFHVKEGSAKLQNGNQKKELKANETAILKDSKIEISEANINLIEPADNSIYSEKTDSIPVKFSWSTNNSNKLSLEISFDSRFKNIYKKYKVSNGFLTTNLPQGKYFWRISTETSTGKKNSKIEYSPFRKFTLYSISPPTLVSPKNNQVFTYHTIPPILSFSWLKKETARSYILEISNKSNFSEIIKTATTAHSSIGIDKLEAGKYFARLSVIPLSQELVSEPSNTISFSIEKKQELDSIAIVGNNSVEEISSDTMENAGHSFQVQDSPEIIEYTLQISNNSNFTKIIKEEKSTSNHIKLKAKLEKGNYYWRVYGKSRDGKKTPFSGTGKFSLKGNSTLDLLSPKNNSTHDPNENIIFQWKRPSYRAKYLLEISDSLNLSNKIHSIQIDGFSSAVSLKKEGTYYWQISSIGEDNQIITKSEIYKIEIKENNQLIPIYPKENQKVDMSPVDFIKFKWEKNPNQSNFIFELYKSKLSPQNLIIRTNIKDSNFYKFQDVKKLDEGIFIWTLRESKELESEINNREKIVVPFKIYLSKKPGAPKIKTPETMYVE